MQMAKPWRVNFQILLGHAHGSNSAIGFELFPRFRRGNDFRGLLVRLLLRPVVLLAPIGGSSRVEPGRQGFSIRRPRCRAARCCSRAEKVIPARFLARAPSAPHHQNFLQRMYGEADLRARRQAMRRAG
jgi:hypothetical protein